MLDVPVRVVALRNDFVLEEALANLRHDLRNRLASIRNATFYVRRKGESAAPALFVDDRRVASMFKVIESEMAAADAALEPRVAPASADARADAGGVLQAVLGWLRPPDGIRVVGPGEARAAARVSEAELELAVWCLVENALDALGAAGSGQAAGGGTVTLRCSGDGQQVAIEVCDDGPGPAAGDERRWLEPFFTTRPGRFGLGLNIARRVALRAGGAIEIAPASPGTCVRLLLPEARP